MMISCSSSLADSDNSSSPHSQGCSPGLSMGQTWAWCCRTGFSPGCGAVPVPHKAKCSAPQAWPGTAGSLSCLAVNTCHSHGFFHFPTSFNRKKPTCCSLATRLSVGALAAGLWSQWFPLAGHHWCFFHTHWTACKHCCMLLAFPEPQIRSSSGKLEVKFPLK